MIATDEPNTQNHLVVSCLPHRARLRRCRGVDGELLLRSAIRLQGSDSYIVVTATCRSKLVSTTTTPMSRHASINELQMLFQDATMDCS